MNALDAEHLDTLRQVADGRWAFSKRALNGYLIDGNVTGYHDHNLISRLDLDGYLDYSEVVDPCPIELSGKGHEVLP